MEDTFIFREVFDNYIVQAGYWLDDSAELIMGKLRVHPIIRADGFADTVGADCSILHDAFAVHMYKRIEDFLISQ